MAVAVVGTGVASRYGNPMSHTLGTGADYVFAGMFANATGNTMSRASVGAMTQINEYNYNPGYRVAVGYGQVAPTSGAQDVTSVGASDLFGHAIISLSGVDQTTPTGTAVQATGTSTSPAVTITVGTGGLACAVLVFDQSGTTVSAGTDETVQIQYTEDSRGIAILTKTGTGSVSFAPTLSQSAEWGIIGVPVAAAAASSTVGALVGGGLVNKASLVGRSLIQTP